MNNKSVRWTHQHPCLVQGLHAWDILNALAAVQADARTTGDAAGLRAAYAVEKRVKQVRCLGSTAKYVLGQMLAGRALPCPCAVFVQHLSQTSSMLLPLAALQHQQRG